MNLCLTAEPSASALHASNGDAFNVSLLSEMLTVKFYRALCSEDGVPFIPMLYSGACNFLRFTPECAQLTLAVFPAAPRGLSRSLCQEVMPEPFRILAEHFLGLKLAWLSPCVCLSCLWPPWWLCWDRDDLLLDTVLEPRSFAVPLHVLTPKPHDRHAEAA